MYVSVQSAVVNLCCCWGLEFHVERTEIKHATILKQTRHSKHTSVHKGDANYSTRDFQTPKYFRTNRNTPVANAIWFSTWAFVVCRAVPPSQMNLSMSQNSSKRPRHFTKQMLKLLTAFPMSCSCHFDASPWITRPRVCFVLHHDIDPEKFLTAVTFSFNWLVVIPGVIPVSNCF